MIVGRGLLAKALKGLDNDKTLFYANGISNSVLPEIPDSNFEIKEIGEIADKNEDITFIYFSTSQVNSEKNHGRAYVKHKLLLEELIAKRFSKYLIIRTSNLVGYNPWNTHTLFNYLFNALLTNEPITVSPGVIRNFLDADHFAALVQTYLSDYEMNKIVEIVNPVSYTMQQIISEFENFFSKKFNLRREYVANDFALFELNTELSLELMIKGGLNFDDHIQTLLKKHYSGSNDIYQEFYLPSSGK